MKERSVGVIGAGRVGTAFGKVLIRSGYDVVGVSARSAASRERAQRILPGIPILDPAAVAKASDILLLAVTDDGIRQVSADLAAGGYIHGGQYVVHVSGACGLGVLQAATAEGAVPLAVHPAMTFPGLETDADHLDGLAFAITSPLAERPQAEQLVRDLGGVPIWIADEDRVLYHAALVLGANNLVTLLASAMEALAVAGVEDPGFILGPLVRTSLENALQMGDQALTGPVRRADTETINAHILALRERSPGLVMAYLQFGLVTAQRARRAALNEAGRLSRVIALFENNAVEERGGVSEQAGTAGG